MAWYDIGTYLFVGGLALFALYLLRGFFEVVLSIRDAVKQSKLPVESVETRFGTFTRQGGDAKWDGEMECRGEPIGVTLPAREGGPDEALMQEAHRILSNFGPYDEIARTYLMQRLADLEMLEDAEPYDFSGLEMRPRDGIDFEANYGSESELVVLEFAGREVVDHTTVS